MVLAIADKDLAGCVMTNFKIEFLNSPWWLLLLIPAVFLTLFPYFRIAKKYRRNRNRIISTVLHSIIMVLCIAVLSGMFFSYDLPNTDNEVLLLVDMSFSGEENNAAKDEYVRSVIDVSDSMYKVGVVTFGYDQVYAAPFDTDTDKVYKNYLNAELPDTRATDIASALNYSRSLFSDRAKGKIIIVSDGAETDGQADMAVRSLVANGIQVNTVNVANSYTANEVQVVDVKLPDHNVSLDETFNIGVTVNCRTADETKAVLTLYESNSENAERMIGEPQNITLVNGQQAFDISCKLDTTGLHRLRCVVECEDNSGHLNDKLDNNNAYYTYINIEKFNNVLIIERNSEESENLVDILSEDYNVTVANIGNTEALPNSIEALCNYDEVILMNIANRDMPAGFVELLYSYVNDYGGGMFTVGGNRVDESGETVANAYDRQDMYGTLYQEMLPVQAINYTPPLGVMIIIDRSGSMSGGKLEEAKAGAKAALYALSERDYCGIMTLDTEFNVEQSIISATNQTRLIKTVDDIELGGGTMYSGAIERAGKALLTLRDVERKHIILISDGQPGEDFTAYEEKIKGNYAAGITFTMVAIGIDKNSSYEENMKKAAEAGHGRYYGIWDNNSLSDEMSKEFKLPEITDINNEPFQPMIKDHTSVVNGISQKDIPMLGGYYGTKIRNDEKVLQPLKGEFVPIYAQWQFGKGRVGSFMCDLSGSEWSKEFMDADVGKKLIRNIISALLPTENIRVSELKVEFTEDNFSTHVGIVTDMDEDDRIEITVRTVPIAGAESEIVQKLTPTAAEGFTRMSFTITEPGVYEVIISKIGGDGEVKAELRKFRTFSYSEEYDEFVDVDFCEQFLGKLATSGGGKLLEISRPEMVFEDMEEFNHKEIDPRWVFISIALILFLLDIAVRKFKFKWIHEIIRDRKNAKNGMTELS